ncbi:hypothetical protein [Frigoriglobus tundricola]|uniref:Lipoprotein n=1 Tax=Frigoriglobus tundricola TaxID=2774151 RepID=A0A6M5Z047_9BACT|nr:hypothetical protein [Frigoriglobus tundricola]QJW99679.1 hypothetical protein FTUN_7298 [Frigoriglobus tundricola]
MRLWILPIAALAGFTLGCNKSPEGGATGHSTTPSGSTGTFKLELPGALTAKDVKQGDKHSFDAKVDRSSGFQKDVTLKVEAPSKIEVTLDKDTVKASDADTKFHITVAVAKDAPIGKQVIKVTGTPAAGGGAPTTGEFEINVTSK